MNIEIKKYFKPQNVLSTFFILIFTLVFTAGLVYGYDYFMTEERQPYSISVINEGEGEAISMGDTLQLHYKGTLLNGTQFDSSYDRGETLEVVYEGENTGLIPGFTRALEGLKKGSKVKVTIPPELGYGPVAQGAIPANSTLIFEIEVVDIQ